MNRLKRLVAFFLGQPKPPHVCKLDCYGYCLHFGCSALADWKPDQTGYHFPSNNTIEAWKAQGFDHALTFQSHWKCSCGRSETYFFLANPYARAKSNGRISPNERQITQATFDEMADTDPTQARPGITLDEMIDHLNKRFGF